MKQDNRFNFFIPIEIEKGKEADSNDGLPKELIISGVASTDDEDEDGEILDPNGYVLDEFLKTGFLNFEHRGREQSSYLVGEPIDAFVKDNKLHIKGKLYKSNPKAVDIYKTALMLEKEGSSRRLGYSIEGKKLKVDPHNNKVIKSAKLLGCAITATPKNKNTFLSIVKGSYADAYIEPEFDETANGGAEYLLDVTKPDGTRITIDKNFNIKILEKAMSAGSATGTELTNKDTNGASLKRESLKKKLVNLQPDFVKSVIEIGKNIDKLDKKTLSSVRKHVKELIN